MEKFAFFAEFMRSGGPVNAVILVLYLITLAVFSERLAWFFRTRCRGDRFFQLLEQKPLAALPESLSAREKLCPLYRMALVFAHNAGKTDRELSGIIDGEGAQIKRETERGLVYFAFAGTIAPLLGLLGTITGLMSAFSQIEQRGSAADISFLAGGIREAMITTATGLLCAICALGAGKLFEHLGASRLEDLSRAVSLLAGRFRFERPGKDSALQESAGSAESESA
jgi:biopolymer transport protein ExbB